ncbi:helix-turn-helix domain-containing protein [Actinomadura nitritigenes]|uniref:helix-turn-helix domain-containing protein n=1 Tax=Actinomadura nitritigenes TaxID=134602 RepID=UPI003D93254F
MSALVSTSDHPARDRAGLGRHAIREAPGPFRVRPARSDGLTARSRGRGPGPEEAAAVRAIKEWIEAHLRDPDLTPAAIAAAHHVSVRQLYRVFEPSGTTVARYVRDLRLERCRRELSDPSLAGLRIGAIASRWGLPDAAGFSRAFRAAYGLSPSAYRERAADPHRHG